GTVYDDYWGMNDAAVVCKQLGCGSAVGAPHYGHFGLGSGPIWIDDGGCNGTESALSDCTHAGWGEHDCEHVKAAGVMCSGLCLLSECHGSSLPSPDRAKIRAVGGEDGCSGGVEVWHHGSWGTVCDNSWDMRDAQVACRQLGCG
ncbi:DMBT1 protein, partial [Alopecoenas beccarii]|nr:DMBT1 protein [Alopecoenas beccarii]